MQLLPIGDSIDTLLSLSSPKVDIQSWKSKSKSARRCFEEDEHSKDYFIGYFKANWQTEVTQYVIYN